MRTSENITLTNGRQYSVLRMLVNRIVDERKIEEKVNKTVDASKIRTGKLVKFYPYLDKAEVQLDNLNKNVICKKFHFIGGSLLDFFTPEGESAYCMNLQEPCIIPREELHVLVADISNEDSNEMLLLGYYHPRDIVGIKPASPGYFKITNVGATNTWGVQIGCGEVNVATYDGVQYTQGEFHEDDTIIDYANSKEVYTKEEVKTLLKEMKKEIIEELKGDDDATG